MSEWIEARREPRLAEILADPIIQALMQRDRVAAGAVERLLDDIRDRHPALTGGCRA